MNKLQPRKGNPLISLILPDLRGGGAERVFLNLAKHFIKEDFAVEFVLMQVQGELLEQVPEEISIVNLNSLRGRQTLLPLVTYLCKARPDALLIGMWPLTIIGILASQFAGNVGRVVVGDHNNLSLTPLASNWRKRLVLWLTIRLVYPLASARLAVSQGVAEDLGKLSGLSVDQFKVIYNPVVNEIASAAGIDPWNRFAGKRIIAVGALKSQKDHETLIRAFSMVHHKIGATLVILGEGCLRPKLEQLVESLRLQDDVHLPGFIIDPTPWYRGADLFVLSSRWEGFGNVIVEALNEGTPVVSTDCQSGPREILEDGRYGRLVPIGNPEALANGIIAALREPVDKIALRARAQNFSTAIIAQEYLDVLFPDRKNAG